MLYVCCVPGRRENYTGESKVHIFAFPTDDERRTRWIKAIPEKVVRVASSSKVCWFGRFLFYPFTLILPNCQCAKKDNSTVNNAVSFSLFFSFF